MRLISETLVPGAPGPNHPPVYPFEWEINLADPQAFTFGHPWPVYARLREEAPVCWHASDFEGPGFW